MSEAPIVLEIDKEHFTVRLYEDILKIDLKGSVKNEIEEVLENKPALKETVGALLGIFAPLHIRLRHIDSVHILIDEDRKRNTGRVKLILPHSRDVVIPLEPKEAVKFVDKINVLIPREKQREIELNLASLEAKKELADKRVGKSVTSRK